MWPNCWTNARKNVKLSFYIHHMNLTKFIVKWDVNYILTKRKQTKHEFTSFGWLMRLIQEQEISRNYNFPAITVVTEVSDGLIMVHTVWWDGGHAESGIRVLWQSSTLDSGHTAGLTQPCSMQAWAAAMEHLRFCAAVWLGDLWPAAGPFWPAPGNAWDERRWRKSKTFEHFSPIIILTKEQCPTLKVKCYKRTFWGAK